MDVNSEETVREAPKLGAFLKAEKIGVEKLERALTEWLKAYKDYHGEAPIEGSPWAWIERMDRVNAAEEFVRGMGSL